MDIKLIGHSLLTFMSSNVTMSSWSFSMLSLAHDIWAIVPSSSSSIDVSESGSCKQGIGEKVLAACDVMCVCMCVSVCVCVRVCMWLSGIMIVGQEALNSYEVNQINFRLVPNSMPKVILIQNYMYHASLKHDTQCVTTFITNCVGRFC